MEYQIKFSFSCYTLADYEAIGSMGPHLIERVGPSAKVESHDVGPTEVSILISTSQPALTMRKVQHLLADELSGRFRGDIESGIVERKPNAPAKSAPRLRA